MLAAKRFPLTLSCVLLLSPCVQAQFGARGGEWQVFGADLGSTKYTPLDQINSDNVGDLKIAWRRPALDEYYLSLNPEQRFSDNYIALPLVIDGVAYIPNGVGLAEAFNPGTGETIWLQQPFGGVEDLPGTVTRGVAYWSDGVDERILVQRSVYLYALNAGTGKVYPDFGDSGRVNLQINSPDAKRFRWGGVPMVVRDVVIIGQAMSDSFVNKEALRGDVRAFDVRTGELRWVFHTIPQQDEFGSDTWEDKSWSYTGHAPMWALFSADEELGLVYMPVSSSTNDMYGGHRVGDNLFSQSLVAVHAETGERVWHYQMVHHGLWDYDPPAAPILMDITVDDRAIQAVTQITKQGFAFVFDRVTGEPVWEIEERPVPPSKTPGEVTSPTQPFPTKPAPFDRLDAIEENLIDFTPELRAEALEITRRYVTGPLFTPPSIRGDGPNDTRGTIQLPGSQGGADVQGAAFDPETGYLYIPSITSPFVADIREGKSRCGQSSLHQRNPSLDRRTPWFTAIQTSLRAHHCHRYEYWRTCLDGTQGDGPRDNPAIAHLNLGPLGVPGRPSPLLTKTLLFIGEGRTNVNRGPRVPPDMPIEIATNSGGHNFRAYDKASGNTLWEVELEAGASGPPVSYLYEGKQYIVVAIGDREHSPELVAFTLPE